MLLFESYCIALLLAKRNELYKKNSLYIKCENQYGRARYFQLAMCVVAMCGCVAVTVETIQLRAYEITRTDVYFSLSLLKIKRIKTAIDCDFIL